MFERNSITNDLSCRNIIFLRKGVSFVKFETILRKSYVYLISEYIWWYKNFSFHKIIKETLRKRNHKSIRFNNLTYKTLESFFIITSDVP